MLEATTKIFLLFSKIYNRTHAQNQMKKRLSDDSLFCNAQSRFIRSLSISEYAQKHKEEVNKIKVES